MKSSLPSFHKMLGNALLNYAPLMDTIDDVYVDDIPEGHNPTKYVITGEDTVNYWGSYTFDGEEITHTLHVWHNSSNFQCKKIMSLALEALTQPSLEIGDGFFMEFSNLEFMQVFDDPSEWKHGVLRFRFTISQ